MQGENLWSRECHVENLKTRESSTKHATRTRSPTNDYGVIGGQSTWELANISLGNWVAVTPQSRQACAVVVCCCNVVPCPRFEPTANQGFHPAARPFSWHQPEVKLIKTGYPQMDSPSLGVEIDQRSGRFRIHPENHRQRVPRVKAAIVRDNCIAHSLPSPYSCSPREVVSPLRVSVGPLDVRNPYKSCGRVLVLTYVAASYCTCEGIRGYCSSGNDN